MKAGTRTAEYGSTPSPRAKAPGKRIVKRVEPFSPWQIMVEDRRIELGLSTRALASAIATPSKAVEHSTVWAWLRSPDGYPPKDTYDAALNRRLAKALQISEAVLAEAYESSRRHLLVGALAPAQQGPLAVLRTLFADSSRQTWKKDEIVKLIDQVRGQA